MKKLIYMALTVITFSCIQNANALMVRGGSSCGEWISDKAQNKGAGWVSIANQNWLLGFLSGVEAYSQIDFLEGTDNDSIFLWVDNYCNANPLKHIEDAGAQLFFELKKQKGLK